eukprot:3376450-Prymnesium_polylepis.1
MNAGSKQYLESKPSHPPTTPLAVVAGHRERAERANTFRKIMFPPPAARLASLRQNLVPKSRVPSATPSRRRSGRSQMIQ